MAAPRDSEDGATRPLLAPERVHESPASPTRNTGTFKRNLGALDAFAIVVSIVVGSGVFTSPGSIDTNVPSPGAALIIWLVGGLLAWTGASTIAELGTAIPGEGGVQPYLQYIFGDVFGFLAAWTWIVAVMPATLAILSIVFIESIYSAAGITDQADSIGHKFLSIAILVVISVANSISTKASTRLNNFFVMTKFVSIAAIVLAGVVVIIIQASNPDTDIGGRDWFNKSWFGSKPEWKDLSSWETLGYYSAALYGALWAYSGWDKAVYISAELSAPARQLPLAINTAVPSIVFSFIAVNAAYYILLPWDIVSTTDSVAVTAITRLLGKMFGIFAAVLICLVVAGSLLGNSFVAGRMAVAAANRNWFPSLFAVVGRVGVKPRPAADSDFPALESGTAESDAPINALVLSAILSMFYILFGSFRALLTFNGLGEYSFFFLTVLGAIVLRFREPHLQRPYKPLLLIPVVFALVSGFVVIRGAIFAPALAVVLIFLWAIGVAFYWLRVPFGAPMRHAHFAFAPTYTPLNHGSYGSHPVSVRAEHLALRAEVEAAPDPFIVLGLSARIAEQRGLAASLLHCSADELVFVPNASMGTDTVLKNLRWDAGDVVLCYEVVYPAVAHGLRWLNEYYGVQVETLELALPLSDDAIVQAMVDAARRINAQEGKRVRVAIIDTIVSLPGVRMPFERLVPALQAEGALVIVDGAHGIGHIDIDLSKLQPDFFVTNLHKWLFVPRGCAGFYVPKRNHHLIRTSLPTSFGYKPLDPQTGKPQGTFVDIFDFTGTSDLTNWLCVKAALKFRNEVCGGEAAIQEYSISIAQRAGAITAEILGTEIMDCPGSCLRKCNFSNVRLPIDLDSTPFPEKVVDWLKRTGTSESGMYYQTVLYRGHWYWRISGTIYLEQADYRKGAEVLKGLCERVRKGEHVPKTT
ncbi:hypothetical protein DL764_000260 [Monosporascus ibericus]|uniref:Aminotransferase class V domain-containing protein n=1 Tax=Monosporascus ibericus TaxID=155417 RepID=A0A4Q4TW24_9PEZI|nr:hypothetical protein DL764_000260 [Monosporascus ibericus]